MSDLDFGPPRRCFSFGELDREQERQWALVKAGYARRYYGETYWWTRAVNVDGEEVWAWVSAWHSLFGSYGAFDDRDRLWSEAIGVDTTLRLSV